MFLDEHAVLHAHATIEPADEAWDLLNRLTKVYMSPEKEFPAPHTSGHIVRYSIERTGGVGAWTRQAGAENSSVPSTSNRPRRSAASRFAGESTSSS